VKCSRDNPLAETHTLQTDLWENQFVKGLIRSPLKTMEIVSLTSVAFRSKSPQSPAWKNE